MSRISTEASNNQNIRYIVHLDNCISCKKYSEAHKIIDDGIIYDAPHCLIVHAGMYILGNGEKQDFSQAESLLRYAADTLDYYPAYKVLADLYKVKFSNRIEAARS